MKKLVYSILAVGMMGSLNSYAFNQSEISNLNPFLKTATSGPVSGCRIRFQQCADSCVMQEGLKASSPCVDSCRSQLWECSKSEL